MQSCFPINLLPGEAKVHRHRYPVGIGIVIRRGGAEGIARPAPDDSAGVIGGEHGGYLSDRYEDKGLAFVLGALSLFVRPGSGRSVFGWPR